MPALGTGIFNGHGSRYCKRAPYYDTGDRSRFTINSLLEHRILAIIEDDGTFFNIAVGKLGEEGRGRY